MLVSNALTCPLPKKKKIGLHQAELAIYFVLKDLTCPWECIVYLNNTIRDKPDTIWPGTLLIKCYTTVSHDFFGGKFKWFTDIRRKSAQ